MSNTGAWDGSIRLRRTPMPAAIPGRHCSPAPVIAHFYQPTYPYAIGPRIGVAYQIDSKTVLRGGWGVVYTEVFGAGGGLVSTNGTYPVSANSPSYVPAAAQFVNIQVPGSIATPAFPVTDPNRYPVLGTDRGRPELAYMADANQNRPPRANQFSIGIQREITPSFVMEASYVGNRVVWLSRRSGLPEPNLPAKYAAYRLVPLPGNRPLLHRRRSLRQHDLQQQQRPRPVGYADQ